MSPIMRYIFPILYYTLGTLFRLFYRVEAVGLENVPEGGVLLYPNHSDAIDPVLIGACLPVKFDLKLHTMAKDSLFKNKPFAAFIRSLGAFPIRRGEADLQAVKHAMQALRTGDNLLMFPEGTRVRGGVSVHEGVPVRAHSGAVMIGIRTGATMIPVYSGGEKKLFHKTRIVFGKPYEPVYSGRHGTSEELEQIAQDMLAQAYALGRENTEEASVCR